MSKFSIILPIYNVEKYIKECIESILTQTYNDFEILCIDDCGTDKSIDIVEKYAKNDARIKIIHHKQNEGLSEARNTGINNATGEYIVCIDSDDSIANTLLEKLLYTFTETNVDAVWYNAYITQENTNDKRLLYDNNFYKTKDLMLNFTPQNLMKHPDFAWNKAYKRSTIEKLNLKYPKGLYFEDSAYYVKAYTRIHKAYYLHEPLYFYKLRQNSIVTDSKNNIIKIQHLFLIIDHIYDYLVENNLFDKYKNIILELIASRIYSVLIPSGRKTAIRSVLATLNKINFPEAFLELKK